MNPELQKEISAALGLEELPEEETQEILDRVAELIMESVITQSIEQLPEDKTDAYTTLIGTNPEPDIVFDFFNQNIPGFDTIVADSVATVASTFKEKQP